MADLPVERVQASRPFFTTGIDFCGPFYYQSEIRNRQPLKCYIALLICFATKAVHPEFIVKDLSTSALLTALKRFISIRGKPKTIWTDNATNFVGAKNELLELKRLLLSSEHQDKVHKICLDDSIDWKFIPPRSPHFGGLWEAGVKSARFHFYRVAGSSGLSFEELRTLVCQISAIINSRPLIPLTEHRDDLSVLTPGHFLIGGPFTATIEPDMTEININRLGHWQRISQMQQIFWKKWSTEYLTQLQQRSKWRTEREGIKGGDIVLIKDENLPPLRWPLARVIDIIPGSDGIARVAKLKTSSGFTKRAITNLCLLPLDDHLESLNFQRAEDVGNHSNE
ncbi:uncharacterized protein LOC101460272 [Ceratitis capitata]|uniref:uncharacterized protein LOC101460272 n=1 Tax=Ceratitis capitata TaxID=7213 RepID=UPI00032989AD|nr:uncharacterized protein LOC101460272 [Ceratitis capitata]